MAAVAALMLGLSVAAPAHAVAPVGPVTANPPDGIPQLGTSGTDGSIEQVRQLVPCGANMYAVGKFSSLKRFTTLYPRNNAASFSATTGVMTTWDPNVNGQVDTIAFDAADTTCSYAYLGGTFTSVGGTAVKNIAKVSTTTGLVDTTFKNIVGGRVAHMEVMQGHLLVGGYFPASASPAAPGYFKSVSPTTGLPDGYGLPAISGNYVFTGVKANPTRVYNMEPSPIGNAVLVMGDFTSVGGLARRQIFRLNLGATSATVSNWYSVGNPNSPIVKNGFNEDCATVEPYWLQAAAWSPDASKIYIATTGYRPWRQKDTTKPRTELCDAAAAFPATEANVDPLWVNYPGCDSLFSAAADASTVYIGGHERWANNPNGCDKAGSGAIAAPGMAGLDSTTGLLSFNPTRARGLGADDMTLTPAGLWVASDNQGNAAMCAGKFGHSGICFLPY
ncbi:MAG: hypothetical protein WCB04_09405 [Mycobacteriales bacterium]